MYQADVRFKSCKDVIHVTIQTHTVLPLLGCSKQRTWTTPATSLSRSSGIYFRPRASYPGLLILYHPVSLMHSGIPYFGSIRGASKISSIHRLKYRPFICVPRCFWGEEVRRDLSIQWVISKVPSCNKGGCILVHIKETSIDDDGFTPKPQTL